MFKNLSKIVLITAILIFAVPRTASAVDWFPIVPCGLKTQPANATLQDTLPDGTKVPHDYTQDCNQCLLIGLGKNVIDMTFYAIVPSVGTLMFLIAGFWILFSARSGKPDGVATGKKIMWDTAIGIVIILGSWLITNFILKSLANDQVASTPWYQIQCRVSDLKDLTDATVPSTGGVPNPNPNPNPIPIPGGGIQCLQSGLNLCQGNAPQGGCANSKCSQYTAAINKYADNIATVNILKAVMEVESSCEINPPTGAPSYGLMQLTPPIPQIYASRCGVSVSAVNQAWLTNPANVEKTMCIAVQWIHAVAGSQCGSSIRNLYAGYNGGQNGACAPSVSCAGQTSCSGEPMKRWECLYENTAHTICNGGTGQLSGYNPTRSGSTKLQYCATNPGF